MSKKEDRNCFFFLLPNMQKKQLHNIHIEKREKKGEGFLKDKKYGKKKTRENKSRKNLKLGW